MKTILEHLRRTVIGAGKLVVCGGIAILAVALPLTLLYEHYPIVVAAMAFLAISWAVGWCRPQ